ncbi:lasso peptide biosynthesis B2 protein [Streptomyces gamaensis]|uniref:Lasso peptide biosynthesis B2 protein n=1 Tax=Streptomyces gamaensis TaxID=1763542 RepID=A0ABW0Z251_9ACTN
MSQVLRAAGPRPPLRRRIAARTAVAAARCLARLRPRRLRAVLEFVRRGAVPAGFARTLRARQDVTAVSTLCAGTYCLQRSLATALLCRMGGAWPTWCAGVRSAPFAAHAWVESGGRRVGEPAGTAGFRVLIAVPPPRRQRPRSTSRSRWAQAAASSVKRAVTSWWPRS